MNAMQPSNVARLVSAAAFARASTVICLLPFALCLSPSRACAQGRSGLDPMEAYRTLMLRRMEESQRSVNEILRRRFEEGRERRRFPSDADKSREAAKAGVVRALTPEERKALARNERGLEHFSKNEYESALKEYEEAVRLCPALAAAHN